MTTQQTITVLDPITTNSPKPYFDNFFKLYDFTLKYNFAIYDAGLEAYKSLFSIRDEPIEIKKIENLVRASFDSTLRKSLEEKDFVVCLRDFLDSFTEMVNLTKHNLIHKYFDNVFAMWNNLVEPVRDTINRTPSEIIEMKGKFDLLHYKTTSPIKHKTPILIVGSLINRHYILDILPTISIVQKFQKDGFDVYATDWRTSPSFDQKITLESYSEDYVENSVEKIQEITGCDKVSLFGYCWGGIFSLLYAATHSEKVKNLILHATPVDLREAPTCIEVWTKNLNADRLVDIFGNIPGHIINLAFIMRNPIEAVLKYPRFFGEPRTVDEIMKFFAIESWLYDSRPIIGEVFRKIVDDIYKKNLLIKNQMMLGGTLVDLKNVTMPCLNIVGEKDDLVPPESSRSITRVIASTDKKLIEFPTGHVGLCISSKAHEKLWPDVVKWLAERS